MTPVQTTAQVLGLERAGAYHLLSLAAPTIAAAAQPGQFIAVAVGGPDSAMLLRRAFALYRADTGTGAIQVVFAEQGRGTTWLAGVAPGDHLDVLGPLGQPFTMPAAATHAVLVAGGYGSAPMFDLARTLRAAGSTVHLALGAGSADRLFGVEEAHQVADSVTVHTDDGSAGRPGLVTDGLAEQVRRSGAVYACGPMAMLRAVTDVAAAAGVPSQVAVEESMACGIGVCMTCVLPVVGDDGRSRMVRSCVQGPVFAGDRVRWDDVGTLPADLVGADTMGGH